MKKDKVVEYIQKQMFMINTVILPREDALKLLDALLSIGMLPPYTEVNRINDNQGLVIRWENKWD